MVMSRDPMAPFQRFLVLFETVCLPLTSQEPDTEPHPIVLILTSFVIVVLSLVLAFLAVLYVFFALPIIYLAGSIGR
jgi:hypothetical protein